MEALSAHLFLACEKKEIHTDPASWVSVTADAQIDSGSMICLALELVLGLFDASIVGCVSLQGGEKNVGLTTTLVYGPRLASFGRTGFHCTADEPSLAGAAHPGSVSGQLRPVRRPGPGRWNYSTELFIQ